MEKTAHKKRFNEEEALEKMEKKMDQKMEKIMKIGFVRKFLNLPFMKKILDHHVVNDINNKLTPSLKLIFTVVGWVSLIAGIIGVFSFLVSLSGLSFMFSLGFALGLRVLVYVILMLAFSLLSLFMGIGFIRLKKRAIPLVVFSLFITVLLFVVSFIPVGLYSYKAYGSFGSSLFNLLLTFVLLIIVVKNQAMFKN